MNYREKIMSLALIWKNASFVFPYFDNLTIDWDEIFYEYTEEAANTANDRQFWLLIAKFINLLNDGHTDVLFPKSVYDECGYLPFDIFYINGSYYASTDRRNHSSSLAEIKEINGVSVDEWIGRVSVYAHTVERFVNPRDMKRVFPFFLEREGNFLKTESGIQEFGLSGTPVAENPLPPLRSTRRFVSFPTKTFRSALSDDGILYLRFDHFLLQETVKEFSLFCKSQKGVRGVVIDVRENKGGMTQIAAKVAEAFIPGKFSGCRKKTRLMKGMECASASQFAQYSSQKLDNMISDGIATADEIERAKRILKNSYFIEYTDSFGDVGNESVFDCPCILLVSRRTVSAAEDFVAMFRSNKRATIVGEPTFGSTGTPYCFSLKGGATARICSVAYCLLDGTEFINRGILPDVFKRQTAEDYRAATDSVLDYAVNFLTE